MQSLWWRTSLLPVASLSSSLRCVVVVARAGVCTLARASIDRWCWLCDVLCVAVTVSRDSAWSRGSVVLAHASLVSRCAVVSIDEAATNIACAWLSL
jgi:hypothetical protein